MSCFSTEFLTILILFQLVKNFFEKYFAYVKKIRKFILSDFFFYLKKYLIFFHF